MSQMSSLFPDARGLTPEETGHSINQNGCRHSGDEITEEPKAKRRKIDLACEQCRTRKARCNGTKPVCGNCARRQEQCVYTVLNAQMSGTNDYISSLLKKISTLENELARMREEKEVAQKDAVSRILVDASSLARSSPNSSLTPASQQLDSSARYMPKRQGTMDAMGAVSATGKKDPHYFGNSSAVSLMEQVFKAIGHDGEIPASMGALSAFNETIDQALFPTDYVGVENFELLPRPLTDFLLNRYWEKLHIIFPILHKPTFMQSYEQLWHPNEKTTAPKNPGLGLGESERAGPKSFAFNIAFNIMLILGMQFTEIPLPEQDRLAFACLQKAKNLLKLDLLNEGSLAVCQTLLLLTQFLQSSSSPAKCWNSIGLASRAALGLGLHTDDDVRSSRFAPLERELRKRVWFAVLALDMIIGMALGRPIQLRQRHKVSLPEAIDEEYLLNNTPQPPDHHSDLSFYVESIKLYRIMRRTISLMYKDDDQDTQELFTGIDRVIELDRDVTRFAEQISHALHWEKDVFPSLRRNEAVLQQQRHVLHFRFLIQRLLLYRPLFLQYCRATHGPNNTKEKPSHSVLQLALANSASMTCVEIAIDLAEVTDRYSKTQAIGEWWYTMFYTRTAALVIVMAMVCEPIRMAIGTVRLETAWESCKDTLQNRLPANSVVKTCLETLNVVYAQVIEHTKKDGGNEGQADMIQMLPTTNAYDFGRYENGVPGFNFLDGGFFADPAFKFGMDDYGIPLL